MTDAIKRPHYFKTQFLHADDLTAEQEYHMEMRRRHNRLLHTWGIAEGLRIQDPPAGATGVTITAGTAYDIVGREIVLTRNEYKELENEPEGCAVYVTIAYHQAESDPSDETGPNGNTRWTEEPSVEAFRYEEGQVQPWPYGHKLILARVERDGTQVKFDEEDHAVIDTTMRRYAGMVHGELEVRGVTLTMEGAGEDPLPRLSGGAVGEERRIDVEGSLRVSGTAGNGTTPSGIRLEIVGVPATANGSKLGTDIWLRVGDGDDSGRMWVEYGEQAGPLLVLSDLDDPPRLQFQQIGVESEPSEVQPQFASWIGHASKLSSDIAIMGGNVGIGTTAPTARLDVTSDSYPKGQEKPSGPQLKVNDWADVSSMSWGYGLFAGNAYWDDGDNKLHFSRKHEEIGAVGFAVNYPQWNKAGVFANAGGAEAGVSFQPNWVAVFESDGNVGIGTTEPRAKLHIAGGSEAELECGGYLMLGEESSRNVMVDHKGIMARDSGAASVLQMQAAGGDLVVHDWLPFTVKADGRVGIGGASPPKGRLHVRAHGSDVYHAVIIERSAALQDEALGILRDLDDFSIIVGGVSEDSIIFYFKDDKKMYRAVLEAAQVIS